MEKEEVKKIGVILDSFLIGILTILLLPRLVFYPCRGSELIFSITMLSIFFTLISGAVFENKTLTYIFVVISTFLILCSSIILSSILINNYGNILFSLFIIMISIIYIVLRAYSYVKVVE